MSISDVFKWVSDGKSLFRNVHFKIVKMNFRLWDEGTVMQVNLRMLKHKSDNEI